MTANDLGPKSKKGALAPDGTPEIAYATSNLTAFLAEFQAVKAPHAARPITPDQGECLRLGINGLINGEPLPGFAVWLDLNGTTRKKVALVGRIGEVLFEIAVTGWRPVFRMDAFTLMDRADSLHAQIRDLRPGGTLLTDGRPAAQNAAYRLVEIFGDPIHWANPIPEASTISGTWCAL